MAIVTAPVAIAPGSPVYLTTPGNAPWGALVLSNLSPYLLQVQAGASSYWLNPWTEMLYTSTDTHAPVVVNAQNPISTTQTSGTAAQVQVTWYDPSETPQGTWPVSLTANAVAAAIAGSVTTQGEIDVLYTGSNLGSLSATIATTKSYQEIELIIQKVAGAPNFIAQVENSTTDNSISQYIPGTVVDFNLRFPFANSAGENLLVALSFTGGSGTISSVIVLGKTSSTLPTRQDGLPHPVGRFIAAATQSSAGSSAILPGVSGYGYLIKQACLSNVGSTSIAQIQVTIATVSSTLLSVANGGQATYESDEGLLCDPSGSITIVGNGSATAVGSVIADLVATM